MRTWMVLVLVVAALLFSACSSQKTIDGVTYDTYGLFNEEDKKNPNVQYEPSVGNIIWGCLLFETIIAPVYFFGFDFMEPVGPKPFQPGVVTN